ncbi:MAG TPA: hypothetical protein VF326_14315 [Anaerolineaceae bacterium]
MIVSNQAPDTLGRRLAKQVEVVKIFGKAYHRRAKVVEIHGFSAHAGQDLLVKIRPGSEGTVETGNAGAGRA